MPGLDGPGPGRPKSGEGSAETTDGLAWRPMTGSTAHLNGYSVIQADDLDQVLRLVRLHPYLMLADGHFARGPDRSGIEKRRSLSRT
jgi:hypothetical protein